MNIFVPAKWMYCAYTRLNIFVVLLEATNKKQHMMYSSATI